MNARFCSLLVMAFVLGCGAGRERAPLRNTKHQTLNTKHQTPTTNGWLGVASCAAAACHGGAEDSPHQEFTTWLATDPHARAFTVLTEPRSTQMISLLNADPGQEKKLRAAHEEQLCLSCHVYPGFQAGQLSREAGVSCESCHGPAGTWIHQHYRDDWAKKTLAEKTKLGMTNTKSIEGRAHLCTACHVGTLEASVGHDLIAAGHPALRFEFSAYHANWPHHWDDAKDRKPASANPEMDPRGWPDFEVRAWVVGQITSAEAALKLRAHRKGAGEPSGTDFAAFSKVDFAEFDCFACHHGLRQPGRAGRMARGAAGRVQWANWYDGMLPLAQKVAGGNGKPGGAFPNSLSANNILKQIRDEDKEPTPLSWDKAAQSYLALSAVQAVGKDRPALSKCLADMAAALRFPQGFDSSPDFDEPAFRAIIGRLPQD